jgi:hypothetical protein
VKLSSERVIEAPADRVWNIIAHQFAHIGEWATAIPASRPITETVGDTDAPVAGRVCDTGLRIFPQVRETIVSYDESRRTFTYVGAGLPAFVSEACNRWHVEPVDDHRSRVRLDATVETRGIVGRLLALPFRLWAAHAGTKMLDDLRHYVEHGRPSGRKQRQLARSSSRQAPP